MINLFRNRKFQITAVILLFLVIALISIDRFSSVNIIRNIVTAPVNFVQKGINSADEGISRFFNSIRDYKYVSEENEQLIKEINSLKEKNAEVADLEIENKRLKDALLLKDKFSAFNLIGANVLSTNPSNYKYELLIDVGTKDGVRIDDPVVASNNSLFGRVYLANLTTSTVTPITDEYSGISGWMKGEQGGHVTVRGSLELKEFGLCIVENIPKDVEVAIGDIVETSGLGGIYPKGIIVGTIVEVFNEESLSKRYAYLEPMAPIKSLNEVFLLTTEGKN
ncbi:MAG: rod shape-determining protein MreC [Clostridia bacterium]|nr:rod shape-determining protein MreC [Clostridia bacterium]